MDGGYEIRLVESGPDISLGACVLLTPLVCQQLNPNTRFNYSLININVFEIMFVLKLTAIHEAKDFGYGRRPFVMCARTGQFQKIKHLYVVFFFGSFFCFRSGEAVREPAEMKQLYISTFPASSLGAHKSALEPT